MIAAKIATARLVNTAMPTVARRTAVKPANAAACRFRVEEVPASTTEPGVVVPFVTQDALREKLQSCVRRMSEEKRVLMAILSGPMYEDVISLGLKKQLDYALGHCCETLDDLLDRSTDRIVPFAPPLEFAV